MELLTWQVQVKTPLSVNTTLQKCKMSFKNSRKLWKCIDYSGKNPIYLT